MIGELCHKIKEKRRVLGYSIEHVVEKTKLHPTVIEDIEDRNLNNISPAYLKGFIRIYASFLGIEVGGALDEIAPQHVPKVRLKKEPEIPFPVKRPGKPLLSVLIGRLKKVNPLVWKKIILVLGVLLVLWFVFLLGRLLVRGVVKLFSKKPRTEQVEQVKVEPARKAAPAPASASVPAEGVVVSITARKKCFLRVGADGNILFEGILDKGNIETWQAKEEIELRISDGSAVNLEVNGRPIPVLASIRKPIKSLKITPSGISVDK